VVGYSVDHLWSVGVGDLNGDRAPDLAVAHDLASGTSMSLVGVWLNAGDGTFAPAAEYSVAYHAPTTPTPRRRWT
jgi:hypothetical protein